MNTLIPVRNGLILLFFGILFSCSTGFLAAQTPVKTLFPAAYPLSDIRGLAKDADGNIFAAGRFGIVKVDPSLKVLIKKDFAADIGQINAITLDADDNVYVTGSTSNFWNS